MNDDPTVRAAASGVTTSRRSLLKGAGIGAVAVAGVPVFATRGAARPGKGRGKGVGGGLVSHYNLNAIKRGGEVHDAGPNRNDGTVVGDVAVVRGGGRVGNAYTFDGDGDYVSITDAPSLAVETVTVAAWVNPGDDEPREYIFDGPGHRYFIKEFDGTENPRFGVRFGNDPTSSATYRFVDATAPLVAGEWTHLAGTYDGDELRLYVDGVLLGANASASGPLPTAEAGSEARIGDYGRFHSPNEYGFNGMIDEVRVYDQALSPDRVASLATQGGD